MSVCCDHAFLCSCLYQQCYAPHVRGCVRYLTRRFFTLCCAHGLAQKGDYRKAERRVHLWRGCGSRWNSPAIVLALDQWFGGICTGGGWGTCARSGRAHIPFMVTSSISGEATAYGARARRESEIRLWSKVKIGLLRDIKSAIDSVTAFFQKLPEWMEV